MSNHVFDNYLEYHIDKNNPETFVIGRMLCADEKWFILEKVTSNGRFDGFSLYKVKDLVMTQNNTEYLKYIRALMPFRYSYPSVLAFFDADPFFSFLSCSKQINKPISLEFMESGDINARGFVSELSNRYIILNQVNEFAHRDGKILLSLSSITRAFLMNEQLENIDLLYRQLNQETLP